MGHASSLVSLVNLARRGNEYVIAKFSFPKLLHAAKQLSVLCTDSLPDSFKEITGSRALDVIWPGPLTANLWTMGIPLEELFDYKKEDLPVR